MSIYQILTDRAILELQGSDAKTFLQGLITNNINIVNPSNSIYSLILTPQGRFFSDFFITEHQDSLLLDCYADFIEELQSYLDKYILRQKIKMVATKYKIGFTENSDLLDSKILGKTIVSDNVISYVDPRFPKIGIRSILFQDPTSPYKEEPLIKELYDKTIPQGHIDLTTGESFPLEFGMDYINAIDFDKGCYLGQELTARTKHRGVVRKKLYKVTSQKTLPNIKTEIFAGDKRLGMLCSAYNNSGIALIRVEDLDSVEDKSIVHINNMPISLQLSDIYNENKC